MFDIGAWRLDAHGDAKEIAVGDELHGIHKLVQRVFIALLQEHDTVKYSYGKRSSPGCGFMTALRNGVIRSEMDVSAHFFLARHVLFAELKADEHASDSPEERFRDVNCRGVIIQPGVMKLKLEIKSQTAEILAYLPIAMPK